MSKSIFLGLTITLVLTLSGETHAQMFGKRTLGSGAQRRRGSQSGSGGNVTGSERFVRGNRNKGSFVGSDSRDIRKFVGSEQATTTGRVQSTTEGLRRERDRAPRLNKPLPPRRAKDRYYPRLELGADFLRPTNNISATTISRRLEESESLRTLGTISVTLKSRTATLRGEVASQSDRKLAEILVGFDPGISSVHNDLVVNTELTIPPLSPPPKIESP